MKRLLAVLGVAMLASLAWGQENDGGHPHHGGQAMGGPSAAERTKHLTKELGLSSDQATKVQQIFEAQDKKREAMMQAGENLSPEDRRAQFVQSRQEVDSQIQSVLNDTQKKKFEAMKSRMKEHRGPAPEGEQAPPQDQQ